MVEEKKIGLTQVSTVLFLAAGVFWASMILLQQGGATLLWPGLASFASAGLMLTKRGAVITQSVAFASALYNSVIFFYQAYSAVTLTGSVFASFASIAAVGYTVGAVTFLFILLGLYSGSESRAPA